ncbi:MAG TPA: fused MFS/spermidine synthase [Thermoanaerobaculia bacterium]|nr:fused MFS/spermidine synthase [Thermoanaerobaculia bacterium]
MAADPTSRRRTVLAAVFFANLLSLACQVLWVRKLTFLFGSTAGVFATVLAGFLLGLALGALGSGRTIDRAPRPWRRLALLLLGLGGYCALSLPLFDLARKLYLALFPASLSPWAAASGKFGLVILVLLPPTLAIGAIFPVAVRLYRGAAASPGGDLSLVYALDTLGAATGALLAGFLLVPGVGLSISTLLLGAFAAGLGLYVLRLGEALGGPATTVTSGSAGTEAAAELPVPATKPAAGGPGGRRKAKGAPPPATPLSTPAPAPFEPRRIPLVLAIFFLTGLAALLLETGWNRFFYVLSGTNVYSLSVVLAGFLSGIGLGSLLLRRWVDRLRDLAGTVAWLYAAIALGGTLVFRSAGFFERVYLGSVSTSDSYYGFQIKIYLTIFGIVLAATLAMGANFPLVARLATPGGERGQGAGRAFFANTAGAVLGAYLGEFVLLPSWGFSGLLLVTLGLYTLAALVFLWLSPRRRRTLALTAALLVAAFALAPPLLPLTLPFHAVYYHGLRAGSWLAFEAQVEAMEVVHRAEGFYGEVAVVRLDDYLLLKHNGKTDASTSPDDNYAQLLLGHLPLWLHPRPRAVLNIGLGGGATLRAVTHHREVESITQVELDPLVTAAARTDFAAFNDHALADPRVELVTNDGRNFIESSRRQWDVIISEPPNIWVSGVSGLFTREFYQAVRRRLAPGGLLCQWFPLHELERDDLRLALATVTSVFPQAALWTNGVDAVVVAGATLPGPDPARLAAAAAEPGIARDLADLKVAPGGLAALVGHPAYSVASLPDFIGGMKNTNVDERPLLEFHTAQNLFTFNRRQARNP